MVLNYDSWITNRLVYNSLINSPGHQLTNGDLYYFSKVVEDQPSGTIYFGLIIGSKPISFTFDVGCSDQIKVEFFEDTDFTGGTQMQLENKNRTSTSLPEVNIYSNPTVNDEGNKIFESIEGTEKSRRIGNAVSLRDNEFFILKPNTKYLMKLTTYNSADISLLADFWEL